MEEKNAIAQKINEFIYQQPDVVVVILQQYGYDIDLKTATLPQITTLVYGAIYNDDKDFIQAKLKKTYKNRYFMLVSK